MYKHVLVSIYPKYLEKIYQGIKNFEFRPYEIKSDNEFFYMWVYETRPVMKINTVMKVRKGIKNLKDSISNVYGLGTDEFYRNISKNNFAYEIIEVHPIEEMPLNHAKELGLYNAPQSYLNLDKYPNLKKELLSRF